MRSSEFRAAEDNWAPAQLCRELAAQLREGLRLFDLAVYPGGYHSFDNPKLTGGLRVFGHFLEDNEPAATDAWAKALTFFAANLPVRLRTRRARLERAKVIYPSHLIPTIVVGSYRRRG